MNPSRALLGGVATTCLLLALLATPARAAEPTLSIRSSVVAPDGSVTAVVAVESLPDGTSLRAEDLTVTDSGAPVDGLTVTPLTQTAGALSVALVIDTSGSTAGRPIADALDAAQGFVARLPAGTTVAVIAFSTRPSLVRSPTTNAGAVRTAIRRLRAGGSTSLYDALGLAARTLARMPGQHNVVVFSDGRDTASRSRASAGVSALRSVKAQTTVVGLRTSDYDGRTLSSIARSTGGSVVEVGRSVALGGAFTRVARNLSSQYSIRYTAERTSPSFVLKIGLAGSAIADTVSLLAPAEALRTSPRLPLPEPAENGGPVIGALASPAGLGVGLAAAFLAGLLLFGPVLLPTPDRRVRRSLRRVLRFDRSPRDPEPNELEGVITSAVGRAAVGLVSRLPHPGLARLQFALVRTGWPLRAAEFRLIQATALLAGGLAGYGLSRIWWVGLFVALAGASVPRLILARAISQRQRLFLSQLPQALDILASSLQSGLSFMQSLDGLVRELDEPAAGEFGRVVSESRLGMPVEESLEAAAERIGSEDFSWVVLAISIQRRTGGNLAQLLRTIAGTLRERDQVRGQIRVLSSEGRLSAIILIALPFALAAYISVVNPGYIGKLFTVWFGRYMVAGALVMMGLGVAWMRKIIRIDI